MRVQKKRGLRRVAGGFALEAGRAHLIVSVKDEDAGFSHPRTRDYNGYRYLRAGRLLVAHQWR